MAYMNPQQYLDAITGIGRGSRYTAFEDPNEADPNNLIKFTEAYQARRGAPNLSGSRAASGTYDPVPIRQASAGTGLTSLQKGLEQFNQQQGGFGGDRSQVAAAPGVSAGGMPRFMANINPGLRQLSEATVADSMNQAGRTDDPQGMMSKIGGFFTRTPGMAQTLSSLGAGIAAESSKPGGSFWTGLARGSDAAMQAEQKRQVIERQQQEIDRTRTQEEEGRAAQKEVNDKIQELRMGWDDTTTAEQMAADTREAGMVAFGNNNSPLGRGLIELARDFVADPEAGPAVRYKTWEQTEGRAPDGTPTRVREVTAGAPGTIGDRQHFVPDLYTEQVSEGVDPVEAARNSWRTGGIIVDPDKVKAAAAEAETRTGQEKLNAKLADAAYDGLMLMVVNPATVDPETGETIPGQPNYADYYMAGATQIRDPLTGAITWEQGSPGNKEGWQSFLASLISNAGSETAGFGGKLLGFFGRSVFLKDNPEILAGYTNALNYINPTVRFLSGAQMTNQEAMRYYNALIPAPGDPVEVIELKRRKRDVLTNAMGGPGISNAAKQRAREDLNLDEDELMVHEHGTFGGDASGRDAADYYLARLTRAIGVTDMTDYGAVIGQVGAAGGVLGADLTIGGNP